MMTWLLLAIGGSVLGWFAYKAARPQRALPARRRDANLFNLEPGDIVQHVGNDHVVELKLTYRQGALYWNEYLLDSGAQKRWLSVEEDDEVEVALLSVVEPLPEGLERTPKEFDYEGHRYRLREQGEAAVERRRRGESGTNEREDKLECHYWDYTGPDGQVASIEKWGEEIELTVGRYMKPTVFTCLPGERASS